MISSTTVISACLLLLYTIYVAVILGVSERPPTPDDVDQEMLCHFCNSTANAIERMEQRSQLVDLKQCCLEEYLGKGSENTKQTLLRQRACNYFMYLYSKDIETWLKQRTKPDFFKWFCYNFTFSCIDMTLNKNAEVEKEIKKIIMNSKLTLKNFF